VEIPTQIGYTGFQKGICPQNVLLATAPISVVDAKEQIQQCRFLDGGSQSSYATESLFLRLGFKCDEIPINGISGTTSATMHIVSLRFSSKDGSYNNVIKCYILPTLTGNMPSSPVNPDKLKMARDIQLADEQFCLPRKVEMIIRADLYLYLNIFQSALTAFEFWSWVTIVLGGEA
jgi:hypothetical protein